MSRHHLLPFFLMCVGFFTLQVASLKINFDVYDLITDARTELEKLRSTVQGAIYAADNTLEDIFSKLVSDSDITRTLAMYTLVNDEKRIVAAIQQIKNIASNAGADISECLQDREDYLHSLRHIVTEELTECIAQEVDEGSEVLTSYKYLVDVTMNRVNALEFQLGLCATDSDSCITPIITQIDLAMVNIPQEIEVEVLQATEVFEKVNVAVKMCSTVKISEYSGTANIVFSQISECMSSVLG